MRSTSFSGPESFVPRQSEFGPSWTSAFCAKKHALHNEGVATAIPIKHWEALYFAKQLRPFAECLNIFSFVFRVFFFIFCKNFHSVNVTLSLQMCLALIW